MPDNTMWIIPTKVSVDPDEPALAISHALGCVVERVAPDVLPDRVQSAPPRTAIILGGTFSTSLIEAQRWLNQEGVPTLILAEELSDQHESLLLGRGAKDVLGLPVSDTRLRGRIDAFLRNHADPPQPAGEPVQPAGVQVDLQGTSVLASGVPIALTRSEFGILTLLARRSGRVVSRSDLAGALGRPSISDRALESHISRLRLKFQAAGSQRVIESVRGQGYRLIGTAEIV